LIESCKEKLKYTDIAWWDWFFKVDWE